jgi:hypothetical protein
MDARRSRRGAAMVWWSGVKRSSRNTHVTLSLRGSPIFKGDQVGRVMASRYQNVSLSRTNRRPSMGVGVTVTDGHMAFSLFFFFWVRSVFTAHIDLLYIEVVSIAVSMRREARGIDQGLLLDTRMT